MGEQVGAAVALREGATVAPEDLIEYTKERIAAYKYPRTVWVVARAAQGPDGQDPAPRGARPGCRGERLDPGPDAVRFASRPTLTSRAPATAGGTAGPGAAGHCGRPCSWSPSALWVRAAFLSGARAPGTAAWCGSSARPSCWWPWACCGGRGGRPARCARAGGRGGPCCSCSVASSVVQAVLTARAVLATSSSTATGATASGPPREVVGGLLAAIALGLVSVDRRRAGAPRLGRRADAADDTAITDDVSDRG